MTLITVKAFNPDHYPTRKDAEKSGAIYDLGTVDDWAEYDLAKKIALSTADMIQNKMALVVWGEEVSS
jgi:hypothetical protein